MAAAHQVNSNANFANFDAFGNTAIPSHLNTSPPSKSLSSGTPFPTMTCLPLDPCSYRLFTAFCLHLEVLVQYDQVVFSVFNKVFLSGFVEKGSK